MSLGMDLLGDENEFSSMSDINMTPLIDVMLVLLIIFIVTMPIMHGAVSVELPKADNAIVEKESKTISVAIQTGGQLLWNEDPVSTEELKVRVEAAAQPEMNAVIRIYADKNVRYEHVAHVLSTVKNGGISKIDFVTEQDLP